MTRSKTEAIIRNPRSRQCPEDAKILKVSRKKRKPNASKNPKKDAQKMNPIRERGMPNPFAFARNEFK